ncbi:MAG: hypothetical protein ACE5I7_02835 [Candidatus Binatia bacterium]
MLGERSFARVAVCLWALCLVSPRAQAIDLRSNLSVLGQVRDGDFSHETEAPQDLYGDLGVAGLHHGSTFDTFFRLEHDFGRGQGPTDFYAGYLHVPGALPGMDFTLGRQFLSTGPGSAFVADAGKLRIDLGGPLAVSFFGGQPRYFEPTFSSESLSQDEQVFGGDIHTTRWKHGRLSLGFLQQMRDQRTVRQLVTGTGTRSFPRLPGLPKVYGSVAFDADRQNLDLATAGVDTFLLRPRLRLNVESSYYKPQDQGKRLVSDLNRREDAIFELFSVSEMLQFRAGLRYALNRTLSAYGDYSYQRYEQRRNDVVNGHIGSVGLMWLPGGDGLEVVRLEYYVTDSDGGNVNGGKLSYHSRVYERILFRSKVDVAYYDKQNNRQDTGVNTLLGLGYTFAPGLVGELDFEANRNSRFDQDFRFGFLVTYKFRQRTKPRVTS